ncbi:(deoxy)nucleoside triphosphate pyrophosphohydrolase [candidate division KSB1 bacterium]|nr:(deoxy)nucleoside triphosphate pyrophosphohydrolase [candidate division KSB1 bacterium]
MKITKLPHYHVTAAFIHRGKNFLITQRLEKDKFGGLWEFPGGKQEVGETLEECLVREIFEELNLHITIKKHLFNVEHSYKEAKITLHLFQCQLDVGIPECKDVQNWRWVDFSTVKNFEFTAADEDVIKMLNEYL